ncbi:MAG: adenylate/guanylate cyclase domain-containing protein, partial [Actinomycetota bacterium]
DNPTEARFCMSCAASMEAAEPAREQRKVVTILFCDLVGSTALGESTDPEALRARMRRYFEDLRVIIERHGGTVEKFVGDAVMAVFGIPVSHEDDALRAVRAAAEMEAAVREHGLEARIGVNTGEVVVGGEGETLVTGDAVNIAARLEQAAPPGSALIGAETHQLVRDAVRVEQVEPLALKGKAEPVEAYRLLEVLPEAEALARHPEARLVGRLRERNRLWRDFEDVLDERSCRLVTLLGPAGIGKSRLVADFLERVGESADVLRGRCLSYGEGITYWPLVEILVSIGVEPDSIIGSSPEETRLAFRRMLETRAAEHPQVIVIDDLQWAEPVFVDLIEHVADFSRDAPILLLCVARMELLELRPGWGGGKLNATSVMLEPLKGEECDALIGNLLEGALLDEGARDRIAAASQGNPLFVEEMLAMVREQGGDGKIVVPPTIHALLQARLDTLGTDERLVIERGAVEGEVFHRGAVAEMAPGLMRPALGSHLTTLVRKELIRSVAATFPDDEGFRFRHLLIRDAAYESLPKATRAELHERFAGWLAHHELVERDEILGYHLEQAHRYRSELDPDDPALPELSGRAALHLGASGRAALDRGDYNAGRSLLRRTTAILPPNNELRHVFAPDLSFALWESGELQEALVVITQARASIDPVVAAIAAIVGSTIDFLTAGSLSVDERRSNLEAARAVLEAAGHDEGLGLYWWSVAGETWVRLRAAETAAACEQGLLHFERAGVYGRSDDLIWWIRSALVNGPTPVADAIERVEALRVAAGDSILLQAGISNAMGRLLAMQGDIERARDLHRAGRDTHRAAGLMVSAAGMSMGAAGIEQRSGDLEACERALRSGLEELAALEERAFYATVAALLARCLFAQGRFEEVGELCTLVRDTSPPDDLINFLYADALEAGLLAHQNRHEEAVARMRDALALVDTTDFVFDRAEVRLLYAEVLALAGRASEAAESATEAIALLEKKGDVTAAARARERLDDLGIRVG